MVKLDGAGFEHTDSSHPYYLARNHLLFVSRQAPLRVKLYEAFRFPKTLSEHIMRHESGALRGIKDYVFRRFGSSTKGAA